MLPESVESDGDAPIRPLLVLGTLTAVFTFFGSLDSITSFASLAFISIFGAISYLALRERKDVKTALIPALGTLGAAATVVALLWHLYTTKIGTFWTVIGISVAVLVVELLYFQGAEIRRGVEQFLS